MVQTLIFLINFDFICVLLLRKPVLQNRGKLELRFQKARAKSHKAKRKGKITIGTLNRGKNAKAPK
jgi:hypothetical protein